MRREFDIEPEWSMGENKKITLSKIERKIFKNTLLSNSNDLKFIDDTRKSQASMISKQPSSIFTKTIDISYISQVSSHQLDLMKLFSVQELDFSGISFAMSKDSVENLQEVIRVSAPGSTITLPPHKLQFASLLITSPITLRGLPGTSIEITNGSIVVDFTSNSRESFSNSLKESALICEVSLKFSAGPSYRSSSPAALFVIDSSGTYLEVRDCEMRSSSHEPQVILDNPEEDIEDVCFWVNGSGFKKFITKKSMRFNSSLIVSSCNISGFFECCRAGVNASISIEKSHIEDCLGNAISAMNPKDLIIQYSVMEKIKKTAIDISIISDPVAGIALGSSRTESLSSIQNERTMVIEGNDIKNTGGYGVNIWSEHVVYYPLQIKLLKNKITGCKKEGIAVRHISVPELTIHCNDCCLNQGTGFWLQKVNSMKMLVTNNRGYDNYSGYGIYIYDTGATLKHNELHRNSLGGIMVVGASKGTETNLVIKKCLVQSNGENGITIMDYSLGTIEVAKCKINENYHDGVHLLQSKEFGTEKTGKEKIIPENGMNNAIVRIRSCEIMNNTGYGLNIMKFKCEVEKLRLSDNQQGNIMIGEDTKSLVTFLDDNKVDINLQVGQNCIVKDKGTFCGRTKKACVLF